MLHQEEDIVKPTLRVRTDWWQRVTLVVALLTLSIARPVQAVPLRQNATGCWISEYHATAYADASAVAGDIGTWEDSDLDDDSDIINMFLDADDNLRGLNLTAGASATAAASSGLARAEGDAHVWTYIRAALSDGILTIHTFVQPTSSASADAVLPGQSAGNGGAWGNASAGVLNAIGPIVYLRLGIDSEGKPMQAFDGIYTNFVDNTGVQVLDGQVSRGHNRYGMYSATAWVPCVPPAFRVGFGFGGNQAAAKAGQADAPVATWTMAADSTATHVNLWRAEVIDGLYVQVNPAPIPAEAAIGSYKEYTHTLPLEAGLAFYKLEVVEPDGSSTFYGPIVLIRLSLEQPVQIDLASFTATRQGGDRVRLVWQTSVGIGSAAYALHQAAAAEGPYTRIDDSLTASQVVPTLPASYAYTHTLNTPPGDPLYYKLEMIDVLGNSTFHGPIEPQAEGANTLPVAHAGWSYIGKEGSSFALNGTASADADGNSLTYDWNFGDGTTLANGGASPSHTYNENGAYQVCLTVTDPNDASATDCTTATIANIAPSVTPIQANPLSPTVGLPVTVTASFSDPGTGDSHSATWGWGDGNSSAATVDAVASSVSGSHSYVASGSIRLPSASAMMIKARRQSRRRSRLCPLQGGRAILSICRAWRAKTACLSGRLILFTTADGNFVSAI
jgi:hypothetical protein